jgi:deoxyribose-phosphate aldolase
MKRSELAKIIDHTLLGPAASTDGVRSLCAEAREMDVASVCVNPCHVALVSELLEGSPVKVCAVVGFPHGMTTSAVKAFEAEGAVAAGADELDMVINVGALKEGDVALVENDIRAVCAVAQAARRPVSVKVILETALLTEAEKAEGARLVKSAGADYVKTSTGFASGGATVEDVALLRRTVGPEMGVKAAGGIRDYAAAVAMIEAGATRLGASRTANILDGADADSPA